MEVTRNQLLGSLCFPFVASGNLPLVSANKCYILKNATCQRNAIWSQSWALPVLIFGLEVCYLYGNLGLEVIWGLKVNLAGKLTAKRNRKLIFSNRA